MEIWMLVMLFAAPVLQFVLSAFRHRCKINLPIWAIAILMLMLGFVLAILLQYLCDPASFSSKPRPHPPMPMALYFGLLITVWSVPAIAAFFGLIGYFKRREAKRGQ